MEVFYGPVLSRRFGYSLGVDIIPYKVCSYDCVYCQLGRTTKKTTSRKRYLKIYLEDFKNDLGRILKGNKKIDYITFSGSGEPTLNKDIDILINGVKEITDIPVVVLTNGSLLFKKEVIDSIIKADLIKVSIDAPDQISFEKINCPHPAIRFALLSEGLNSLLSIFQGKVWIEIMLIKGFNDSLDTAYEFKAYLKNLEKISLNAAIDKVHLNTPVRPPEGKNILPPDKDRLIKIKKIIGDKAELIKERQEISGNKDDEKLKERIIGLTKRRPVSVKDISGSLQVNINQVIKCLKELLETKKIEYKLYKDRKYYFSK